MTPDAADPTTPDATRPSFPDPGFRWFDAAVGLFGVRVPRVVSRRFPDVLWRVPATGAADRRLFLTFDDGPDTRPGGTAALLDRLARAGAHATFFFLGQNAAHDAGLVRAAHDAGHTVGNHTYAHPDPWKTRPDRLLAEAERTQDLLQDLTGAAVPLFRPPYGHLTGALRSWARRTGGQVVMWDVMPGDFLASAESDRIAHHVVRFARPGSIVVLHEGGRSRAVTPAALDVLLPRLTGDGWALDALSPAPPALPAV